MILMEKNGMKKFVSDVFVEKYKAEGFVPIGEGCEEQPFSSVDTSGEEQPQQDVPEGEDQPEDLEAPAEEAAKPEAPKAAKPPRKKS